MRSDTIAAISSAVADSGIGIVRISGDQAFAVADRIYRSRGGKKKLSCQPSHTIHYGYIADGEKVIDEVLVMLMRAPRTFTTQDTVEINCHGGVCAMREILKLAIQNGARLAQPGEFTKRAFLNGRIDLSQAEAVMDVIGSQNEYALRNSVSQLRGSVRRAVESMRGILLYHLAYVEAALDDPEHMELDGYADKVAGDVRGITEELTRMIRTAENGRILKEGIRTAIVGRPNVGKSSLLNALLGQDRAIVTAIAGTTRDTLEETANLNGITLHLVDTAGIRRTEDLVEKIGVQKAREKLESADLVLYVADCSEPLDGNDEEILRMIEGRKALILLNKSDLEAVTTEEMMRERTGGKYPVLTISAADGTGMERLEDTLEKMFYQGEVSSNGEVCITNLRHRELLLEAKESLERVLDSAAMGMPEDFLTIDLRGAYEALGRITGETFGEDLADEIFGKFCMGK